MKEAFKYYIDGSEAQNVVSASVSFRTKDALIQSATLDVINTVVPPYADVKIEYILEGVSRLLGTFIAITPNAEREKHYEHMNVSCYSTLYLLSKRKLDKRYTCKIGTNVVNEISRIYQTLGIKYSLEIEASEKTTSIDTDYEIGTSYLDVFNAMLKVINYTSLYPTQQGNYKAHNADVPRGTILQLDENDKYNVIIPRLTLSNDYFEADNVYVRYVDSPTGQLVATYENNNPSSPISTVNAPISHNVKEIRDVADLATLTAIAKRECLEDTQRIICGILYTKPISLWYNDVVKVNINSIKDTFCCTGWSMDCKTGCVMEIEVEKEVQL